MACTSPAAPPPPVLAPWVYHQASATETSQQVLGAMHRHKVFDIDGTMRRGTGACSPASGSMQGRSPPRKPEHWASLNTLNVGSSQIDVTYKRGAGSLSPTIIGRPSVADSSKAEVWRCYHQYGSADIEATFHQGRVGETSANSAEWGCGPPIRPGTILVSPRAVGCSHQAAVATVCSPRAAACSPRTGLCSPRAAACSPAPRVPVQVVSSNGTAPGQPAHSHVFSARAAVPAPLPFSVTQRQVTQPTPCESPRCSSLVAAGAVTVPAPPPMPPPPAKPPPPVVVLCSGTGPSAGSRQPATDAVSAADSEQGQCCATGIQPDGISPSPCPLTRTRRRHASRSSGSISPTAGGQAPPGTANRPTDGASCHENEQPRRTGSTHSLKEEDDRKPSPCSASRRDMDLLAGAADKRSCGEMIFRHLAKEQECLPPVRKSEVWRSWNFHKAGGDIDGTFKRAPGEYAPVPELPERPSPSLRLRTISSSPLRSGRSVKDGDSPQYSKGRRGNLIHSPDSSPDWREVGLFNDSAQPSSSPLARSSSMRSLRNASPSASSRSPGSPLRTSPSASPPSASQRRTGSPEPTYFGSPIESLQSRSHSVESPRNRSESKAEAWRRWNTCETADIDRTFKKARGRFSPSKATRLPRSYSAMEVGCTSEVAALFEMPSYVAPASGRQRSAGQEGSSSPPRVQRRHKESKSAWRERVPTAIMNAIGRSDGSPERSERKKLGMCLSPSEGSLHSELTYVLDEADSHASTATRATNSAREVQRKRAQPANRENASNRLPSNGHASALEGSRKSTSRMSSDSAASTALPTSGACDRMASGQRKCESRMSSCSAASTAVLTTGPYDPPVSVCVVDTSTVESVDNARKISSSRPTPGNAIENKTMHRAENQSPMCRAPPPVSSSLRRRGDGSAARGVPGRDSQRASLFSRKGKSPSPGAGRRTPARGSI